MRIFKRYKKSFLLCVFLTLLLVAMSVSAVMASSGGSGEGDDCQANLNYKNIGGPYKGTIKGWVADGKIYLCTPEPLIRSNSDCTMDIPCNNPYKFGSFPLPEKPKDLTRWCRTGLDCYVIPGAYCEDECPYGLQVSGYESIDSSKPNYMPDGSFTADIVIMPLYVE